MTAYSTGIYSVNFDEKNSYEDWHMIAIERPAITFPPVKTKHLDVWGMDGDLDFTETLTGYPTYGNRQGSLKFRFIDNPSYQRALSRRNEIAKYLHGKVMWLTLDEEPEWHYEGRFECSEWKYKGKGEWADIEISYNLKPYKFADSSSTERWLWDPFSFENGIILEAFFSGIVIDTDSWTYINNLRNLVGDKSVVPTVTIANSSEGIAFGLYNSYKGAWETPVTFGNGSTKNTSFTIRPVHTRMRIRGHGTWSMDFLRGIL